MRRAPGRLDSERGSVLIAGLLLSLALMMLLGAAVDIGHAFIVHRDLITAAADAALAGSQHSTSTPSTKAKSQLDPRPPNKQPCSPRPQPDLQTTSSARRRAVQVSSPAARSPTILLRLVGLTTLTVTAQATAAPRAP